MSNFPSETTIIDDKSLYTGKFLHLKKKTVEINGRKSDYEYLEYSSELSSASVTIVPLITYSNTSQKKIVIIANHRIPVNNFVLEFPGGISEIDGGELDALRELKEETGFIGKRLLFKSNNFKSTYYDSWKSKDSGKMLFVEIDGDDEANKNASQELDDIEIIKVFLLDFDSNLIKKVEDLAEKNNFDISDQLYSFCLGLCFHSL